MDTNTASKLIMDYHLSFGTLGACLGVYNLELEKYQMLIRDILTGKLTPDEAGKKMDQELQDLFLSDILSHESGSAEKY